MNLEGIRKLLRYWQGGLNKDLDSDRSLGYNCTDARNSGRAYREEGKA